VVVVEPADAVASAGLPWLGVGASAESEVSPADTVPLAPPLLATSVPAPTVVCPLPTAVLALAPDCRLALAPPPEPSVEALTATVATPGTVAVTVPEPFGVPGSPGVGVEPPAPFEPVVAGCEPVPLPVLVGASEALPPKTS